MDSTEVNQRWQQSQQQSRLARLPRWVSWRVKKKVALWSGRARKDETKLFWGQPMTIVYPEYVSGLIGKHGYFEEDLTTVLLENIKPGMVVYDVGAHFGFYSLLASELVGDAGHVYSFEPTKRTYDVLAENAGRCDNITASNIAAFSETCEISFWDQGLSSSSLNFIVADESQVNPDYIKQGGKVTVPAVKLDEFAIDNRDPDFLKVDAEGAEGPILHGMQDIITRSFPAITLECGDDVNERTGNNPCRENVQFLLDHGYEAFDYRSGQEVRHELTERYGVANILFRHPQWRFVQQQRAA
ncbi:MAG: FkbM family methyltransferase [Pirellulaceae bacterium]